MGVTTATWLPRSGGYGGPFLCFGSGQHTRKSKSKATVWDAASLSGVASRMRPLGRGGLQRRCIPPTGPIPTAGGELALSIGAGPSCTWAQRGCPRAGVVR